jgi:hypothetical protein
MQMLPYVVDRGEQDVIAGHMSASVLVSTSVGVAPIQSHARQGSRCSQTFSRFPQRSDILLPFRPGCSSRIWATRTTVTDSTRRRVELYSIYTSNSLPWFFFYFLAVTSDCGTSPLVLCEGSASSFLTTTGTSQTTKSRFVFSPGIAGLYTIIVYKIRIPSV